MHVRAKLTTRVRRKTAPDDAEFPLSPSPQVQAVTVRPLHQQDRRANRQGSGQLIIKSAYDMNKPKEDLPVAELIQQTSRLRGCLFKGRATRTRDMPLFVDPFAISLRQDRWEIDAHALLVSFFRSVVDRIRDGRDTEARRLLSHLQESNETRLGLSRGRPQGAGIGSQQADDLFSALKESQAANRLPHFA